MRKKGMTTTTFGVFSESFDYRYLVLRRDVEQDGRKILERLGKERDIVNRLLDMLP